MEFPNPSLRAVATALTGRLTRHLWFRAIALNLNHLRHATVTSQMRKSLCEMVILMLKEG
ncbi:MAG TPA: hypothetical protein DHT43_04010 [Deltaproteobacteria bacterium]|nr:hypothetical protein [Deltaproteobacteria bacterium]